MGKIIKKQFVFVYNFLRKYVFGGRGLSRIGFLRNANFAFEKFLRGKPEKVFVKYGLTIHLDPRESLVDKLRPYEPESTALLFKHLKPGDVFVDVGTSIGWFTLIAAKLVGQTGKVYSFEPEPHSFELLGKNITANKFEHVVVARNAAVSNKNGKATLYVPGNAWTWSSLEDQRKKHANRIEENFGKGEDKTIYEHEVDSVTLDSCLSGRVDFLKIDAEGEHATDDVFDGASGVMAGNPNMKLLVEHPSQHIIDTMMDRGYRYALLDKLNGFFTRDG